MLLTDTSTYLKIYFLAYKLTIYILLHYCLLTIYTLSILFSYILWVLFHICHLSYSYFVMQFLSHILGVMTWHGRVTSWGRHFIAVLYTFFLQYMSYSIFCIQIFSTLYIYEQLCNMWNVHFSIVFIHIWNLRWLYLSLYSYLHIFFVSICLL